MKKVILLVTLLSIFMFALADNSFGIKGGLNLGSFRKTGTASKFHFGAIGGIFYNIPLNQQYSIQPELLFTMKGIKHDIMLNYYDEMGSYQGEYNYKSSTSISYIEIPILGKMELNRSEKLSTYIYAGPFVGFNLDNSYKVEFHDSENEGSEDINLLELGFTPGIMLEFSNNFVLDARYTYGMTGIYDRENYNGEVYNTVLSFMVGYKIK